MPSRSKKGKSSSRKGAIAGLYQSIAGSSCCAGFGGLSSRAGASGSVAPELSQLLQLQKSQQGFLPLLNDYFHHLLIQYSTKSNKSGDVVHALYALRFPVAFCGGA